MEEMKIRTGNNFSFSLFETTTEEREQVYAEVRDSHQMKPAYLAMLVLACLVATLGLLSNSTAVVIGAMLISPLMSPFLSAGLALAVGDWALGKAALKTIGWSILGAVLISALTVWLSPLRDPNSEILSRTNPNLLDLGIAFFSGCAGTYTVISRKGLTTIPGVAIATAVMPPLCVVGFGLQHLDARIMLGAGSLFLTNLAAIVISAAVIFLLASFRVTAMEGKHLAPSTRIAISLCTLVVLAIPLAYALVRAADQSRLRRTIEATLRREIEKDPARARLGAGLTYSENAGQVDVEATVRTTLYFSHAEVEALSDNLEKSIGRPVQMNLDQVLVKHGGLAAEPLTTPVPVKISEETAIARLSDAFQKETDLAATILQAKKEGVRVTVDGKRIVVVELIASVSRFPAKETIEAARRAFSAQSVQNPAIPNPRLLFRFHPLEPIRLTTVSGSRNGEFDKQELSEIAAFLESDPDWALKVETVPEMDQATGERLRQRLVKDLGVPDSRVLQTSDSNNNSSRLTVILSLP
jgi:uncharacterized hydrophobic protein (TIGR00271 family)